MIVLILWVCTEQIHYVCAMSQPYQSFTRSREELEMLAVYGALQNPQPKAICIECIDLRFAQGFEHFREEMLEVSRHEDIVMRLAGSLTPLAYPNEMPSRCKYLKKQLVFKCKKFPSIERIIVIAHKNCAYYDTVPSVQNHRCNDEYGIERGDLPLIGSFLEIVFPGKSIELYHADLIDGGRLVAFNQVPLINFELHSPHEQQRIQRIMAIGTKV